MKGRTFVSGSCAPELWGGIECTLNRVGTRWYSQLERNGHLRRPEDLERIAALGIRALRFPLLWEQCAPRAGEAPDFHWARSRLKRLGELGIMPILGLVHHGSGPAHTHLLDAEFAPLLAHYAGCVARQFPEVIWYTPVNEPLTTARFSGLYGHWYPHGREARSFVRALINQCVAIVRAMQAVRRVNPAAQLLQTDDLGRTYASARLGYQADFDNERRWLGWDLVAGRVGRDHPLWGYLAESLGDTGALEWLRDHPCPPDLIGINHYVTSNRFLDEDLARYPPGLHGGNGRHRYADVEAVRVLATAMDSWAELIAQAAARYGRGVALTEVHLGCDVQDQIRWFQEAWRAASSARRAGIDVRGVTAWALFGSFDWNSLVTRDEGHYEPGAFDVRSGTPVLTGLGAYLRDLGHGRPARSAAEPAAQGWWQRPERLIYGAV